MKMLALDFSSPQRSVAVVRPTSPTDPLFQSEIIEVGAQSTGAFSMIERALAESRLEREEIDCVAIGLGPGSYTGIRVAIAIAQGWQLARGVRLLGMSSVECLAAQAQADGRRGSVPIAIDAQRGEFYLSTWHLTDTEHTEIEPLHLIPRSELEDRARRGERLIGPSLKRWGLDAVECYPGAMMLGRLAQARDDFLDGPQLKPIYLRETTFVKAPPPRQV